MATDETSLHELERIMRRASRDFFKVDVTYDDATKAFRVTVGVGNGPSAEAREDIIEALTFAPNLLESDIEIDFDGVATPTSKAP